MDFKKACDSVRKEVLYILIDFGIPMKLLRLIRMYLNETCSKVHIDSSYAFPIQNGLKQLDTFSALLCFRIRRQEGP
jgi:hypothetical protein